MIYLLDTNILLLAHYHYYPLDRILGFWRWLLDEGRRGIIKVPQEVFLELLAKHDPVSAWTDKPVVKHNLVLNELADDDCLDLVNRHGYQNVAKRSQLTITARTPRRVRVDPAIVAKALELGNASVVTNEKQRSGRKLRPRSLPRVCKRVAKHTGATLPCITDLQLYFEHRDFRLP